MPFHAVGRVVSMRFRIPGSTVRGVIGSESKKWLDHSGRENFVLLPQIQNSHNLWLKEGKGCSKGARETKGE